MGWRVADKPRTIPATKSLAKQFAEMLPLPGERPLSERRLVAYRKAALAGEFRPVTWAKCLCKATGDTYRVNGQHTSTLIASMDKTVELYVTIESYEADAIEDVAQLYSTFDSRLQTRATGDINRTFAASVPELAALPGKLVNQAVSGLAYAEWQDKCWSHEPAERAELLLDNIEFALWLHEFSRGGETVAHSKPCLRAGVIAAMRATYARCKRDHDRFWSAVRDESGTDNKSPDRKLASWLIKTACRVGQGGNAAKSRSADQREFYAKSLHAWNAWRRNASTDLKYFPEAKLPVAV